MKGTVSFTRGDGEREREGEKAVGEGCVGLTVGEAKERKGEASAALQLGMREGDKEQVEGCVGAGPVEGAKAGEGIVWGWPNSSLV